MRLGATVPRDALDDGRGRLLGVVARAAEEAGLASMWMSDHLLMVDDAESYPYTDDGSFTRRGTTPWYESLTVLSWLAAQSTTLTVGTSVLVAPQRNPLELAKVTATIDALSRGRLVLGVGTGWLEAEFDALGSDFATRGRRLDSTIDVLRLAWQGTVPAGDHGGIAVAHDVFCHPRPDREWGIPVLVGGMTERAVRRVIERGDGWLARAWIDELVDHPHPLAEKLQRIRAGLARDPARAARSRHVVRIVTRDSLPAMGDDGRPSRQLVEAIATARDIGFDEAAFDVQWTPPGVRDELRRLVASAA